MITFDAMPDTTRWVGTLGWKRSFELRESRKRFASLLWDHAGGQRVVARSHDLVLRFSRAGFGGRRVVIHDVADGTEFAGFSADGIRGGTLQCASGRRYVWGAANGSLSHWMFRDATGAPVVELRVDSMGLEPAGPLTVHREHGGTGDLPLLATLGWYLAVQTLDDAALLGNVAAS